MERRFDIQNLLQRLYSGRLSGDVGGTGALFCANAGFRILGASQRGPVSILADGALEIADTLALLFRISKLRAYEQISMIIDGDNAAVHWRATVHSRVIASPVSTEFVDIIRVSNRCISSFTELFAPLAFARRSGPAHVAAITKIQRR